MKSPVHEPRRESDILIKQIASTLMLTENHRKIKFFIENIAISLSLKAITILVIRFSLSHHQFLSEEAKIANTYE